MLTLFAVSSQQAPLPAAPPSFDVSICTVVVEPPPPAPPYFTDAVKSLQPSTAAVLVVLLASLDI
jgi:hypothetical protein